MLIQDLRQIGNKLLALRKDRGLTQAELAEKAGLADRTYADIERGTVNMRLLTLVKICIERLRNCPPSTREALTWMLKIFLDEIGR